LKCYYFLYFIFILSGLKSYAQNPAFNEDDWDSVSESGWVNGLTAALQKPDTVQLLRLTEPCANWAVLKKFPLLKGLRIQEVKLANLNFLLTFKYLKIFECYSCGITDIGPLSELTNLEEIVLNYAYVKDLTPLKNLKKLKILKLYENEIEDLSPLANLKELVHLDLSANKITDVTHLQGMNKLMALSLYKNPMIKDLSVLKNFPLLNDLNISLNNQARFSLSWIKSYTNLENLRIQGMVKNNAELKYISGLVNLKQLTMGLNDSLSDLSPLSNFKKLEYLDIHSNNVKNLQPLSGLTNLIKLVIYNNSITDLTPLRNLNKLQSLFCFNNPITDFKPLYGLESLKMLRISGKQLSVQQKQEIKNHFSDAKIYFL